MRKFLVSVVLLFSAINIIAQEEYLSFKGIPIEGSMKDFCQKLKTKGFTQARTDKNITFFTGDFTGRQAIVGVGASDDGQSVHTVVVLFEESSEWDTLVNTYDYYKSLYTKKYGEPTACQEHNPSSRNDNLSLMLELGEGRVTYASAWDVIGGAIELSIIKDGYTDGRVVIRYRDSQNINAKIQKDLDDI